MSALQRRVTKAGHQVDVLSRLNDERVYIVLQIVEQERDAGLWVVRKRATLGTRCRPEKSLFVAFSSIVNERVKGVRAASFQG